MRESTFIRAIEADNKGATLASAVRSLQMGAEAEEEAVFSTDVLAFQKVPKAPFAYWTTAATRDLFEDFDSFEGDGRAARVGLQTSDDFRFLRLWWEVSPAHALDASASSVDVKARPARFHAWCRLRTRAGKKWVPLAKGGAFSKFYSDLHLVINWLDDGSEIKEWAGSLYNNSHWSRIIKNVESYFCPGSAWSRRSQKGFSMRAYPAGSIFSDKGPVALTSLEQAYWLALFNSGIVARLLELQMSFGSYEVGVIQRTPVPSSSAGGRAKLEALSHRAVDLKQCSVSLQETSHVFVRPALLQAEGATLADRLGARAAAVAAADAELTAIQAEIDDLAYALYGLSDDDRRALETALPSGAASEDDADADEDDEADVEAHVDPAALAHGLLSYALGCAVGRWDARFGTGEREAPPFPDPFAPLPVCSPGMLQGDDGFPLATPPAGYPLDVDADGVLVDDPDHADDVLARVRAALALFFDDVEAVEAELCRLLGEKNLRAYLQKKGGFFKDHVSRYSKSRRKAPIYWYLRSSKGNYGLWVYLHLLDGDTLFKALENYVLPKIQLEQNALEGLRVQRTQAGTSGRDAKRIEKALDGQEAFLSELEDFRDKLKRAADLRLVPDLDDGVVLTSAPLHELMPWSEPATYWKQLLKGEHAWSSISRQLHDKGLVQAD